MKAGTTIMEVRNTTDIDQATCRFTNGQRPNGSYFDKKENKVYCGDPSIDKRYTEDGESHTISPPPFSKTFTYFDYDGDGYMDAALKYSGRVSICSSCGSTGIIFLTKKSKDGKIVSILPKSYN